VYCSSPRAGVRQRTEGPRRLICLLTLKVFMHKRIVDDSDLIRGLVRTFIESRPGMEVCGEAAGVSSVVSKTDQLTILGDEVQRLNGWVN
jgi:hypothetical protein